MKNGIVSRREMANFAFKQAKFVLAGTENMDDIAKIQDSALSIVKGRRVDEMEALADDVFDEVHGGQALGGHARTRPRAPGRGPAGLAGVRDAH